jgi:outer membrane protein assembly factor BamB
MNRNWQLVLPWLVTALTVAGFTPQIRGQNDVTSVFLPAPRILRQHLTRARAALAEKRFGDAILELGPVLSDAALSDAARLGPPNAGDMGDDYFVPSPDSPAGQPHAKSTSAKSEAQRLIGTMPRRGLELYELQFGADARALLDEAVSTANFWKLNEVVRRYFHTKAGYEAMHLLGRLHFDRGYPLAAALCFKRISEAPVASRFDPELSVLLAACWLHAERPQLAAETLAPLRQRFPRAEIRIGSGNALPLPDPQNALAWLRSHFQDRDLEDSGATAWLLHRGDAARNATARGGMPLSTLRWQAPTAEFQSDETLIDEIQNGKLNQADSIPSLSPLAVDDVILMRSPDRMLAIDFSTGKRIWHYPWSDSSHSLAAVTRRGGAHNQEAEQRKAQLDQRLWQDVPYGQVSSDGDSVYLLDNLQFAPPQSAMPIWRGPRLNRNWPQKHNQLVALDLHRQGSLKWTVGGETGEGEPKLAGAFFLGAPLPINGQLFLLAELSSEIRLVVLDERDGHQQWSQQLAHVDTFTVMHDQRRRLAGASPSFSDGVLVCPTSAGAVVAIELASRSLLWGYEYSKLGAGGRSTSGFPRRRQARGDQWIDATTTIADGAVVLTPVDSNKLFCLDLLTGTPLWTPVDLKPELSDVQFVASVHDGNIVLAGRRGLNAIRLDNGKPFWDDPDKLHESEAPSGRGFRTGQFYFFPTTASRLIKVDLDSGKIVDETSTDRVLGNLICYKDEVVSQGTDYLATFYQREPLRKRVKDRLRVSPDDAWALARKGELFINEGQLQLAIGVLRRAYELQPEDEATRSLLVGTLLSALQEDFSEYRVAAAELEPLVVRPRHRLEYLRLMAAGLHAVGEELEATEKYLELVDLISSEIRGKQLDAIASVQIDDSTSARFDRWLRARLGALFESAGDPAQSRLNEGVQLRWQKVSVESIDELQKFVAFFDFHPLATTARSHLAIQLAMVDRRLEAELVIGKLGQRAASIPTAVHTAARVGAVLNERRQYEASAVFYRMLTHRWRDSPGTDGRTGHELAAVAAEQEPLREVLKTPDWPWGLARTSIAQSINVRRRPQVIPIPIHRSRSRFDDEVYSVSVTPGSESSLSVNDGHGRLVTRVTLDRVGHRDDFGLNYAERNGHLLVAVNEDNVVAIDILKGAGREDVVLWSDRLTQSASSPSSRGLGREALGNPFDTTHPNRLFVQDRTSNRVGMLGCVNNDGVVFLKSRKLLCVDPVTGRLLWERKNVERGVDVFGDDEYVFLAARDESTAVVFSADDGSLLGTRRVPQHRWTTSGRLVLTWQRDDDSLRLRLNDPWLESDVWSEEFAIGSRGTLTGASVAVMEPNGRFTVRSLTSDVREVDAMLESVDSLNAIHLLRSSSQYLLITDRENEHGVDARISEFDDAPLVNGKVYAFDRSTGALDWQTPAAVEGYGFAIHQPAELPAIWFVRSVFLKKARPQDAEASVLCIDRRDGRIVDQRHNIPNSARTHSLSFNVDFGRATVRLLLPKATVSVVFTSEPVPPAPPAQATDALPPPTGG